MLRASVIVCVLVSRQWDLYLVTTVSDWSKSTVLDLTEVAGQSTSKRCRATAGRVEVCNAAYGSNGWLGIASRSANGSHITQGTVKLNDTYFNMAQYNTPAWRNLVSCQEVGHTLGLDHQDTNFNNTPLGTCMDYSVARPSTSGSRSIPLIAVSGCAAIAAVSVPAPTPSSSTRMPGASASCSTSIRLTARSRVIARTTGA